MISSIVWAIIGVILLGLEAIVPGFVIFFFGLGALITALLALVPGIGGAIALQAVLWLISSVGSLAFFRKKFSKVFKGKLIGKESDQYIGRKAEVIEDIGPGAPGRIKVEGTSWKAESYNETIPAGETVEILEKDNLTFIVTKSFLE